MIEILSTIAEIPWQAWLSMGLFLLGVVLIFWLSDWQEKFFRPRKR